MAAMCPADSDATNRIILNEGLFIGCDFRALRQAAMAHADRNVEPSISPTRITSIL